MFKLHAFLYNISLFFPPSSFLISSSPDPLCADVIDLSSGEDDTVVHVSSESTNEEVESEPSGAHVNDTLNRPDTQGRVLVNLNHPDTEDDIFLSPQLARVVKPHQVLFLLHAKQTSGPFCLVVLHHFQMHI